MNYQPPEGARYLIEVGAQFDPVETMLNHLSLQLALGLPIAVLIAIPIAATIHLLLEEVAFPRQNQR